MNPNKYFTAFCALFLGVLLPSLWFVRPNPDLPPVSLVSREDSCGPRALWVAVARLGVPASWQSIQDQFRDGTLGGTTLSELREAAEILGIDSDLKSASWSDLFRSKSVAILFVSGNHFIVADASEVDSSSTNGSERIRVYDSDQPAEWFTESQLKSIWQGRCLLLTHSVAASRSVDAPSAALNSCYNDLGVVRDSSVARFQFIISNRGTKTLLLKNIRTTCRCTEALLSCQSIEPGQSATLDCAIDLSDVQHRFSQNVAVETNDPAHSAIVFTMCGAVPRHQALSSRKMNAGEISPGTSAFVSVGLYDDGNGQLQITHTSSRLLSPVSRSRSQPNINIAVSPFSLATAEQRRTTKLATRDMLISVQISVPYDCGPGEFEVECAIDTNLADQPRQIVIIRGRIIPDLIASPPAVILRPQSHLGYNDSECVIRSKGGRPLGQLSFERVPDLPLTLTVQQLDTSSVALRLTPDRGRLEHATATVGRLICSTPDGRSLELPVMIGTPQADSLPLR